MKLVEMDPHVTYLEQLAEDDGPVVLINQFTVAPEDIERFLEIWADDASFMQHLGRAFRSPEFQARIAHYPSGAVTAPHVFKKVAVQGVCDE